MNFNPSSLANKGHGAAMKSLSRGHGFAKKYGKKGEGLRKEVFRQHECFWQGKHGEQQLRACPSGGPNMKATDHGNTAWEYEGGSGSGTFKRGGLVTRGSRKEKSRLNGSFRIV